MIIHLSLPSHHNKEAVTMPKHGTAWEEDETLHLLDAIDEYLPINPEEWEQVKALHDQRYGSRRRTMKTLMRVYGELARTTEPTGNPNIPVVVKLAKEIRERIRAKTDGTTGSPDDDDAFDDDDGEEGVALFIVESAHSMEV